MKFSSFVILLFILLLAPTTQAQEAVIRRNLAMRLPSVGQIDEVRKAPITGLFEVRVGAELFYTDAAGDFLIQGRVIDTKRQRDLTAERIGKLTAVDFSALPLQDAITIVRGNGRRKVAVFSDPNCGYCKYLERDLARLQDITVYMFLYPVFGGDSLDKSRDIWCANDKARAWEAWMVRNQAPLAATCDTTALARNVDYGKKHRISGTPTLLFPDGNRVASAINAQQVRKLLGEPN